MTDMKTWGWVKVIGGLIALWWAWKAGLGLNINGAVAILALLTIVGGYWKTTAKGR